MSPIDYLFDICGSGTTRVEALLDYADAREHLEQLTHADPASLSAELLAEIMQIIEIYEYLIPEMMRRDHGEDYEGEAHVVCRHNSALLDEVASINADLAMQHASLEVELSVRGQETAPDDDAFLNALVNFFPSDDYWEWPEV